MKLKDLKIGDWFTLKPIPEPTGKQVFIRGEYDRTQISFQCGRFDDISYTRYFSGKTEVYTDFTF